MKKQPLGILAALLLASVLGFALAACTPAEVSPDNGSAVAALSAGSIDAGARGIEESGEYTSPEDVAAYLHQFGRLPDNYITKDEAHDLGWDEHDGNLWDVAPGKSIGGSHYGNYEGSLPDAEGRRWKECDVNYSGGYRGAERLLYSNDGLIYYTGDHYQTFTQLGK